MIAFADALDDVATRLEVRFVEMDADAVRSAKERNGRILELGDEISAELDALRASP